MIKPERDSFHGAQKGETVIIILLSLFYFNLIILPNQWECSVRMNTVYLRGKRKDQDIFLSRVNKIGEIK